MKRVLATSLAFCLLASTSVVSAQAYREGDPPGPEGVRYDTARVIRVDPVFDSRSGSAYATAGQRCRGRQGHVRDDDGYSDGRYPDAYQRDDGDEPDGDSRRPGTQAGATAATVVGGIVGAVIGSKVGGGSARYATSAIGSMVGGMAGRQIYEQGHQPDRAGTVVVCDPVPAGDRYGDGYSSADRAVNAYDVTYEYAGQQYTTRTDYHPGDRIRVRVDVRAE